MEQDPFEDRILPEDFDEIDEDIFIIDMLKQEGLLDLELEKLKMFE